MRRQAIAYLVLTLLITGCGSEYQSIVGTWKVQGKKELTVTIDDDSMKMMSEGKELIKLNSDKERAWNSFSSENSTAQSREGATVDVEGKDTIRIHVHGQALRDKLNNWQGTLVCDRQKE